MNHFSKENKQIETKQNKKKKTVKIFRVADMRIGQLRLPFKVNKMGMDYGRNGNMQSGSRTSVPRLAKTCLRAYADNEGPDQPAHPRSLIRAFTIRKTE